MIGSQDSVELRYALITLRSQDSVTLIYAIIGSQDNVALIYAWYSTNTAEEELKKVNELQSYQIYNKVEEADVDILCQIKVGLR